MIELRTKDKNLLFEIKYVTIMAVFNFEEFRSVVISC